MHKSILKTQNTISRPKKNLPILWLLGAIQLSETPDCSWLLSSLRRIQVVAWTVRAILFHLLTPHHRSPTTATADETETPARHRRDLSRCNLHRRRRPQQWRRRRSASTPPPPPPKLPEKKSIGHRKPSQTASSRSWTKPTRKRPPDLANLWHSTPPIRRRGQWRILPRTPRKISQERELDQRDFAYLSRSWDFPLRFFSRSLWGLVGCFAAAKTCECEAATQEEEEEEVRCTTCYSCCCWRRRRGGSGRTPCLGYRCRTTTAVIHHPSVIRFVAW